MVRLTTYGICLLCDDVAKDPSDCLSPLTSVKSYLSKLRYSARYFPANIPWPMTTEAFAEKVKRRGMGCIYRMRVKWIRLVLFLVVSVPARMRQHCDYCLLHSYSHFNLICSVLHQKGQEPPRVWFLLQLLRQQNLSAHFTPVVLVRNIDRHSCERHCPGWRAIPASTPLLMLTSSWLKVRRYVGRGSLHLTSQTLTR